MLDIKWIREHPEELDHFLCRRGVEPLSSYLLDIDNRFRRALTKQQELQSLKNKLNKEMGILKSQGQSGQELMQQLSELNQALESVDHQTRTLKNQLECVLESVPNILDSEVPFGQGEEENVEVRRWGDPKKVSNAEAKPHEVLGQGLGLLDFEQATKVCGARFVYLKGDLARLERALASWLLDQHREAGYTEFSTPVLVRQEAPYGAGQLPKFAGDLFQTTDGRFLISTGEVTLVNWVREKTLSRQDLPLRLTACTSCFRSEAGAAGKDTRGMMRMHEFKKVELVMVACPEESEALHQEMVYYVEGLLQALELPYRVMLLCSADIGATARKTYDLEVWVPSQNQYREISSCSNCGDYQARRQQTKYKDRDQQSGFVHTLNGSGLPLGRTLLAIMENYQQPDGSFLVPKVLQPYLSGLSCITGA